MESSHSVVVGDTAAAASSVGASVVVAASAGRDPLELDDFSTPSSSSSHSRVSSPERSVPMLPTVAAGNAYAPLAPAGVVGVPHTLPPSAAITPALLAHLARLQQLQAHASTPDVLVMATQQAFLAAMGDAGVVPGTSLFPPLLQQKLLEAQQAQMAQMSEEQARHNAHMMDAFRQPGPVSAAIAMQMQAQMMEAAGLPAAAVAAMKAAAAAAAASAAGETGEVGGVAGGASASASAAAPPVSSLQLGQHFAAQFAALTQSKLAAAAEHRLAAQAVRETNNIVDALNAADEARWQLQASTFMPGYAFPNATSAAAAAAAAGGIVRRDSSMGAQRSTPKHIRRPPNAQGPKLNPSGLLIRFHHDGDEVEPTASASAGASAAPSARKRKAHARANDSDGNSSAGAHEQVILDAMLSNGATVPASAPVRRTASSARKPRKRKSDAAASSDGPQHSPNSHGAVMAAAAAAAATRKQAMGESGGGGGDDVEGDDTGDDDGDGTKPRPRDRSRNRYCLPCPTVTDLPTVPLQTLYLRVPRQFTMSIKEIEEKQLSKSQLAELISVPVRIMGIANDLSRLYFVAKDMCLLVCIRKGNVAKSIGQFDATQKAILPVLCPRSNGSSSTHKLTTLSLEGVKRLLRTCKSPLAPHVLRFLLKHLRDLERIIANSAAVEDNVQGVISMQREGSIAGAAAASAHPSSLFHDELESKASAPVAAHIPVPAPAPWPFRSTSLIGLPVGFDDGALDSGELDAIAQRARETAQAAAAAADAADVTDSETEGGERHKGEQHKRASRAAQQHDKRTSRQDMSSRESSGSVTGSEEDGQLDAEAAPEGNAAPAPVDEIVVAPSSEPAAAMFIVAPSYASNNLPANAYSASDFDVAGTVTADTDELATDPSATPLFYSHTDLLASSAHFRAAAVQLAFSPTLDHAHTDDAMEHAATQEEPVSMDVDISQSHS